ncbi:MAG: type II toxin-antitoxin system VapB family antitoxin [Alphaproteobacteria bacterium]|nr:type II toxin-antitoxin system VapB family antitoxin [Alphaproteobacteria bacterium]
MNIRYPRIDERARKLAARTGEDPTQVVIHVLEEKLQRTPERSLLSEDAQAAQLLAIAERATGLQGENRTSRELVDELYDEDGLPL